MLESYAKELISEEISLYSKKYGLCLCMMLVLDPDLCFSKLIIGVVPRKCIICVRACPGLRVCFS